MIVEQARQQQKQQRPEPGALPQSIVRNAKRTAEMIESEYDVEELERKLKKARKHLEDQRKGHREKQVPASLRIFDRASSRYGLLHEDPELARKKEIVLAILSCNKNTNLAFVAQGSRLEKR
jgi:hypothetical protein